MAAKRKTPETAPDAVQETAEPADVSQPLESAETVPGAAQEAAEPAELSWPAEYAVIALKGLNLRKEPNREAEVLAVLPKGVGVWLDRPIEDPDGWVEVCTGYLTGWVMARYLARLE